MESFGQVKCNYRIQILWAQRLLLTHAIAEIRIESIAAPHEYLLFKRKYGSIIGTTAAECFLPGFRATRLASYGDSVFRDRSGE
jgi:hypothetical protein